MCQVRIQLASIYCICILYCTAYITIPIFCVYCSLYAMHQNVIRILSVCHESLNNPPFLKHLIHTLSPFTSFSVRSCWAKLTSISSHLQPPGSEFLWPPKQTPLAVLSLAGLGGVAVLGRCGPQRLGEVGDALAQGQQELHSDQRQPLAQQGPVQETDLLTLPAAQQLLHSLGQNSEPELRIKVRIRTHTSSKLGIRTGLRIRSWIQLITHSNP